MIGSKTMRINKLAETLDEFYGKVLVCEKYVLGTFEKRKELLEVGNSEEPLSEELKYLYKNYDIGLSFLTRNLNITGFDKLHQRQYGFKYYLC
jgi:hypothetical protein